MHFAVCAITYFPVHSLYLGSGNLNLHLLPNILILVLQILSFDSDDEKDNAPLVSKDLQEAVQDVMEPLSKLKVDGDSNGKA